MSDGVLTVGAVAFSVVDVVVILLLEELLAAGSDFILGLEGTCVVVVTIEVAEDDFSEDDFSTAGEETGELASSVETAFFLGRTFFALPNVGAGNGLSNLLRK